MRAAPLLIVISLIAGAACASRGSAASAPPATETPYVLVLGTAQDGGLPHAACTCDHCRAARHDPTRRRLVASLAIVVPATGRRYLIDATPDLREQLDRLPAQAHPVGAVDRAPVDGILLTHAHTGHYLGLAFLGYESVHARKLPVMATPRMASFLRDNGPWSRMIAREEIELRETPPGTPFDLDAGIRVTPFAVPHRDEDSDTVGYVVQGPHRTLLYVPDTDRWETWSPTLRERLAGCDVALIDGTFYSTDELPGRDVSKIGHPLITTSMTLLGAEARSGRVRIAFTHLNHSNAALDPHGDARRAIIEAGFTVASDGERLPL